MIFKNQIGVVTGGGNGIGRGVAREFAAQGATVAILDIDIDSAHETERLIVSSGGSALALRTDVSDEQSVAEAFRAVDRQLGQMAFLANIAGVELYQPFLEMDGASWDRNMAVNLKSVFLCCQQAIPRMTRAGGGAIVNTSSVQAFATTGQNASYAAAKAGILTFTKDLARDYGPRNIRINAICPGCVESPMMDRALARLPEAEKTACRISQCIPLRRIGTPKDIAGLVLFLCSPAAAYITGISVTIDGGLMTRIPLPEAEAGEGP